MSFSLRAPVARRLAVAAALSACLLGLASARAQPAAAGSQPLDLRVSVSLAPGSGSTLSYRGTFTGAPLGSGKVSLRTKLGGGGDATVSYTMSNRRGSISGSANVTLSYTARPSPTRASRTSPRAPAATAGSARAACTSPGAPG